MYLVHVSAVCVADFDVDINNDNRNVTYTATIAVFGCRKIFLQTMQRHEIILDQI